MAYNCEQVIKEQQQELSRLRAEVAELEKKWLAEQARNLAEEADYELMGQRIAHLESMLELDKASFEELRKQNAELAALVEAKDKALEDLVSCMEGVIAGDYKPDSFTLQPAQLALSLTAPDALREHDAALLRKVAKELKELNRADTPEIVERMAEAVEKGGVT